MSGKRRTGGKGGGAAATGARLPPLRWPNWGTPTSMNSAASTPGPMTRSRKANGILYVAQDLHRHKQSKSPLE